jgi:hypothetical protein
MKISDLRKRLRQDRPMTTVTINIPEDLIDDLRRIAPRLGFSGYHSLIRAYIGQGLRQDLERSDISQKKLTESHKQRCVEESDIAEAIAGAA